MRIALINPPIRINEPPRHPPYGLALLGSLADLEGYEVLILDCQAFRLHHEVVRAELRGEAPLDVIGVGGFIPSYRYVKFLLPFLRKDHPDALLVSGGGAVTSLQEDMMRWVPEIDVGVVGEGERTFMELLEHTGDRDFSGVKGVLYREDGEIVRTPPRPLMTEEELNELPYPKFDLLPLEEVYWKFSGVAFSPEALTSKRRLPLLSSRGCPFVCKFCLELMTGESRTNYSFEQGPKIRFHSADYVVDMIKWMRLRYATDFVNFLDECFTADKERATEICHRLEDEGLSDVVKWGCTAHPSHVDPELLKTLRDGGCTYLDLGFESADDRILKEVRKGTTVERNRQVLRWCLEARVQPITNFIYGFPGTDIQSVYNDARFWRDNGILVRPFWLGVYPKTSYWEEYKERILEQFDGDYEKFVEACEKDTDSILCNITSLDTPTLIGLREMAITHDLKGIKKLAELKGVKLDE